MVAIVRLVEVAMDIYEARRQVLLGLIRSRFDRSRAAFAEKSGISPTYVTRMLKEAGEKSFKRIGDDMALKIEEKLDLEPGALLNPLPSRSPTPMGKRSERDRSAFGQRMLEAREHAGLKQKEVCKALLISQGTLSGLEGPDQSSSRTVEFARLYHCDPTWLATGEGSPNWRNPMAAIVRIVEYKNRDTIKALQDMLERAKRGEILGLCFAYKIDQKNHGIGLTGEYFTDPTDVLAVASRIEFEVNMLVRERNAP